MLVAHSSVRTMFGSARVLLTILFFVTSTSFSVAADRPRKPNVILILADDLGWSDTRLFGTTQLYETPHIERLASRGMTFSRAYAVSPLCSPTRASILTGLNPARLGLTSPNCHLPQVVLAAKASKFGPPNCKATVPRSVTRLQTEYYTLAEALRDNGYATGHFGKWHLGSEPYSPLQHGFDVDVPHWPGPGPAGSYVAPWRYPDFDPNTPNEHIEDRMAQEAVEFMEAHRDEPFFLNYWMFSVHAPFDAKSTLIEKYRRRIDSDDAQRSPTYAAMIESMDDAVGTLLETLDRLQLAENTIIVFASDNGGNMYNEIDETTPTSNAPLRGGKATMYEGGVRVPAIFVVPGMVAAGSTSEQVTQSVDLYPTLLELLDLPTQAGQQFDGVSIVPALKGLPLSREWIFTYFPHNPKVPDWLSPSVSVHHGDWKLIRLFHAGENGNHRWKLFNLANDLGETNDLSNSLPEKVQALDRLIESFLMDTQAVRPLPNPAFDPSQYRPEDEGVSQMNKSGRRAKAGKPVAGWQAGGTCRLRADATALTVTSFGGDPYLSYRLPAALSPDQFTLQVRMTGESAGAGQIFWQEQGAKPAFSGKHSQTFKPVHDGQPHEYKISFATKRPLVSVRLDPATAPGELMLERVTLLDGKGNTKFRWVMNEN